MQKPYTSFEVHRLLVIVLIGLCLRLISLSSHFTPSVSAQGPTNILEVEVTSPEDPIVLRIDGAPQGQGGGSGPDGVGPVTDKTV